jgi:hypothetical protein
VYGYAALTPASRLLEAGAHGTFSEMAVLPSLIERGPNPSVRR